MQRILVLVAALATLTLPGGSSEPVIDDDVYLMGPHVESASASLGERHVLTVQAPPVPTLRYGNDQYTTQRSYVALARFGEAVQVSYAWAAQAAGAYTGYSAFEVRVTHNGDLILWRDADGFTGNGAWRFAEPGEYVIEFTGRLGVTHYIIDIDVA